MEFPEKGDRLLHASIYSNPADGRRQGDPVPGESAEAKRRAREALMSDPAVEIIELDDEEPPGF